MIITIEKTETIKFDCDLERKRIQVLNNAPQAQLLDVVNYFEKGDLHGVERILNEMTDTEKQHINPIITETFTEMKRRDRFVSYRFTHCKL